MNTSTWIALGALAVSTVSAVVAVYTTRYARASADAARDAADAARVSAQAAQGAAEIEAERRTAEREPRWHAHIDSPGDRHHRLVLDLKTTETVEHVSVYSLQPHLLWFTGSQQGVIQQGDSAESVRPIRHGRLNDACWRVEVPDPSPGGSVRIELKSTIGDHTWKRILDVALPPQPPMVMWGH